MRQHNIKQKRIFFFRPVLPAVFLVLATLLILPRMVLAADYYVDINALTDGNGSAGTPWKYLHSAATALYGDNTGHTLNVAAGVYSVTNGETDYDLEFNNSNFTLQGDPGGGTIIDAGDGASSWYYGLHFWNCSNVTISDLEIRNAGLYGIYLYDGADNTVTRCAFYNHSDVAAAGIALSQCDVNTLISGNIFYDNYYGVYIWSAGVDTSPTIINNLIYDGPSSLMETGIYISATVTPPATIAVAPQIYHNTIDGGADAGIDIDNLEANVSLTPDIRYNNITNFDIYGIADTGSIASTPTIDYNNLFNNTTNYYSVTGGLDPGTNYANGDPLYNDTGIADYHIQAGSACFDAAVTSTTPFDLDGTDRTAEGLYPDIGCYEHIVVPPSGNLPPETPDYVSPAPFEIIPPSTDVTLAASAFSDPEGDSHQQTHWRITRADIGYFSFSDAPWDYVATSTDLTSYTIPATYFDQGLAYQWQVGYQDSGSGEYAWSRKPSGLEIPPDVFVIGVPANDVPLPVVEAGTTLADYQMISFTHIPQDPRAAGIFDDDLVGGYDRTRYRIGTYDCEYGAGAYREYPAFNLYPGGAAWVLAKDGLAADISGVPVNTLADVEVQLRYNSATGNGWNMVGPPNNRNYTWTDVLIVVYDPVTEAEIFSSPIGSLNEPNPYIETRFWEWVDGAYVTSTTTMEVGHGYWVRAKQPNINLRFEPVFAIIGQNSADFNPKILLARATAYLKRLAGKIYLPTEAIAADDSPPAPMAAISSSGDKSSVDVSCFVSSLWE